MPEHDWSSHGASAFRTLALSWRRPKPEVVEKDFMDKLLEGSAQNLTFGKMKQQHFARQKAKRQPFG